ncbi:MAG: GtrA family protein [Nocardioidaceae bacterium]
MTLEQATLQGPRGRWDGLADRVPVRFRRYLTVGVASVAVDSLVLLVLHGWAGMALGAATTVAFASAFVVNFSLNMHWVFDSHRQLARRLLRYGSLVVVNYGVTILVVLGLSSLGLYYLLAKWVAIGACVMLNYVAYRRWVFA